MNAEVQAVLPDDLSSPLVHDPAGLESLREQFAAEGELLVCPEFVTAETLAACIGALPGLTHAVHRSYLPGYKKSGSVSRYDLDRATEVFGDLYRSPALRNALSTLVGADLELCPESDPHAFALYFYTEPGDHIGFHYDTSYYRGARYTALLGLVDESNCVLECEIFRDDPSRPTRSLRVKLAPGTFVLFNGDKVYHRLTPLGEGERRIALTMEFVTDTSMHPLRRFISNMKDAVAYFGFRRVFQRIPS